MGSTFDRFVFAGVAPPTVVAADVPDAAPAILDVAPLVTGALRAGVTVVPAPTVEGTTVLPIKVGVTPI